jgi:hypothetical protein
MAALLPVGLLLRIGLELARKPPTDPAPIPKILNSFHGNGISSRRVPRLEAQFRSRIKR